MVRFFFRVLATLCLAVAVVMAVVDATRSIAASAIELTPLQTSWLAVSPKTLATLQQAITTNLPAYAWDPVTVGVLRMPGFAVFLALALILYAIGRRPQARIGRFATET